LDDDAATLLVAVVLEEPAVRCAACGRMTVCDGLGVGRVDDDTIPREYPTEKTIRKAVIRGRCGRSLAGTAEESAAAAAARGFMVVHAFGRATNGGKISTFFSLEVRIFGIGFGILYQYL
jgi:hypothetical protein